MSEEMDEEVAEKCDVRTELLDAATYEKYKRNTLMRRAMEGAGFEDDDLENALSWRIKLSDNDQKEFDKIFHFLINEIEKEEFDDTRD